MPCQITLQDGFYFLAGQLDDTANLSALQPIQGVLKLNFRNLISVNSVGLGKLMNLIQYGYVKIEYHECPGPFLDMVNAVPSLLGPKQDPKVVKSVLAPFFCQVCNQEKPTLVQMTQLQVSGRSIFTPPAGCPTCGSIMRFDDDPTDVFLFLLPKG